MSIVQSKPSYESEQAVTSCGDVLDPAEVAKSAGLRYVSDSKPGIRRKRAGKHFSYTGPDGKPIRDPEELRRIRSLAIPPAWTNVWICPNPNGHIQATGRDAKGRKQYRYHPRWREMRDETKYNRMIAFGETLPRIRTRVARDLSLPGGPTREKVLAAVLWLLDTTSLRVGNEEYARENKSYGLTTLRNRHVAISGTKIRFHFRGKGGKEHTVSIHNRQLARIIKRLQDLPGYELFEYLDEHGQPQPIESSDVNDYLREISGQDFTAKDFRTWAGTVYATGALQEIGKAGNKTQARKNVNQAIDIAAQRLGNSRAICRKCYVHPAIIDAYLEGTLLADLNRYEEETARASSQDDGLRPDEQLVLKFLKEHDAMEE